MTGFDYGNARIRARRTTLLQPGDFQDMARSTDLQALYGWLGSTGYAEDIEEALPRFRGPRVIDAAVGTHLARQLNEVCGFYPDPTRARLRLVLGRWDVRNLLTIVRALTRAADRATPTGLVTAGRLTGAVLDELSAQSGVRAMLDLLASWRVPSAEIARAARRAIPEFERTGNSLSVESAIERGFASEVDELLADAPPDLLSTVVLAERKGVDLVSAARLRAARFVGEPLPDLDSVWLTDDSTRLGNLVWEDDLSTEGIDPIFAAAAARWSEHQDPVRLRRDVDAALLDLARAGYLDDPLGIGVPVAYMWELENEARALRLVARAVGLGLDETDLEVMVP